MKSKPSPQPANISLSATNKKQKASAETKAQKEFRRSLSMLHKLKEVLKAKHESADLCFRMFNEQYVPVHSKLAPVMAQTIKTVHRAGSNGEKLTHKEENLLEMLMDAWMEHYLVLDQNPDDEIHAIYEELYDSTIEEMRADADEMAKDMMGDMLNSMGIKMDISQMNVRDAEDPDSNFFTELSEKLKEEMAKKEAKRENRKKSDKQIAEEQKRLAAEEMQSKSVSALYKQLAKLFHPDLESDPNIKPEKEELMKRLTVAYENNDLHTLLQLQLTYISNNTGDVLQLANEQLEAYNAILKAQIDDLKVEISMIFTHPRFHPMLGEFTDALEITPSYVSHQIVFCRDRVKHFEIILDYVAKGKIKKMIKERGHIRYDDFNGMEHFPALDFFG